MIYIFHLTFIKFIFLLQVLKNLLQVLQVCINFLAEDKYLVKVHCIALAEQVLKGEVHQVLKGCRCIRQTQRHNNILKQTHRRKKGRFVFMAFFDSNLVISARQVNSTEHSRFTKLIEQVVDTRYWKHIKVRLFI